MAPARATTEPRGGTVLAGVTANGFWDERSDGLEITARSDREIRTRRKCSWQCLGARLLALQLLDLRRKFFLLLH